jgi:hypothetical protein
MMASIGAGRPENKVTLRDGLLCGIAGSAQTVVHLDILGVELEP